MSSTETQMPACSSQAKPSLEQGKRCFGRCRGSTAGASVLGISLEEGKRKEGRTG